ncbi:hypothetical protein [Methyloferula stellata]|uniref:hypothetical protein n=1 Tax=Methyloferula stellata TaxID=876270 RepID=UPI00039F923C|nr:hypothetical protein [Methyloferula stellata]
MARNLYIAYVSVTAAALLVGIIGFSVLNSQAHAQNGASAATTRCFVGNKMDRPSTHMTRGWVCVSEPAPAAIN